MPKDNLLSVLFKSAGQGVSSVPAWKERTNLDKIRQAESQRSQQRLELEQTQQEMKKTELMNKLEAGLREQEDAVKEKEFERIVFSDPKGAVANRYTTESEIQQKWPTLWDREFNPETVLNLDILRLKKQQAQYDMDLDAKRLKAMYEANEEARKQQKHEYDMKKPYSGTGDSKTGDGVSAKKYRQDIVKQNPGLIVGEGANPARVDSLVAGGMGQPLPEYVNPIGTNTPVKLDMGMFQRSLEQVRNNIVPTEETEEEKYKRLKAKHASN